jgi:hypothetical protein
MSGLVNAVQPAKTVGDPAAAYDDMRPVWQRCRAVINGSRAVKSYDSIIDRIGFSNTLIPFSPNMTQQQYDFYKAEAELPGISAQYAKTVIGGLLRKSPVLHLPDSLGKDKDVIHDWIINEFGRDDTSMIAFLDRALWEELQTSRAWIFVDYPEVADAGTLAQEDFDTLKPYPILHSAENIINWKIGQTEEGTHILERIMVRGFTEVYGEEGQPNEFHAKLTETIWVHEIVDGKYRIRIFKKGMLANNVPLINGVKQINTKIIGQRFDLVETKENILIQGEPLDFIPAWPLNGSLDIIEPILSPVIEKEIAIYNKMSRRNHLLYGAATYTPVISSNMTDEQFQQVVDEGLGAWIKLYQGDTATVLETPTAALQDMDKSISSGIEEMAKLGLRMLTPEVAQSGVALDLRNASQNSQLGTLNIKISTTVSSIIAFMINWKYGTDLSVKDVKFTMSNDFDPTPLGADWLRLATEWYQGGLLPRSVWLSILKHNDILDPEYDDEAGVEEMNNDPMRQDVSGAANQIDAGGA